MPRLAVWALRITVRLAVDRGARFISQIAAHVSSRTGKGISSFRIPGFTSRIGEIDPRRDGSCAAHGAPEIEALIGILRERDNRGHPTIVLKQHDPPGLAFCHIVNQAETMGFEGGNANGLLGFCPCCHVTSDMVHYKWSIFRKARIRF